jgi:nickel-type superoxide dismutase maturation protease
MPRTPGPEVNERRTPSSRRLFSRRVVVHDESMRPTLEPGDRLLVDIRTLRTRAPRVGEIVVFPDPALPERWLIKRVAAIDPSGNLVDVRGDAAERARDSRQFGPVSRGDLIGVAYRRYAPPSRRGDL